MHVWAHVIMTVFGSLQRFIVQQRHPTIDAKWKLNVYSISISLWVVEYFVVDSVLLVVKYVVMDFKACFWKHVNFFILNGLGCKQLICFHLGG